ncbi:MAG TPA: c-type cytochrome domain-containing protein [Chryseolinea sp.]|nr:c-type cytochrome domain-containing protein [Chryseolinea sp.]
MEAGAPGIIVFLGRFHPLIIHFPVVLVFMALLLEGTKQIALFTVSAATIATMLGLGLAGGLVSVGMGLMLFSTGEYTGAIVSNHLWGGILFTSSLSFSIYLFLSYCESGNKRLYRAYIGFLVIANVMLVYTSHAGGSLTHGSEFLTEYMPDLSFAGDDWQPKPAEEMVVFEDVILPILDKKCMSCHNENKAKGDLIMTSYQKLLNGGKSDRPTLTPGSSAQSDVHRRVTLPLDDDERMPPEGKIAMTKDEMFMLAWWIDKGADPALKVQTATQDSVIAPVMQSYLKALETMQHASYLKGQSMERLIKTVSRDNYVLRIDPTNQKGITLSMSFPPSRFGDNDLLNIQPVFPLITKASFISSDITDDGLYHIGQMTSLTELYLQQTKIKGSGLIHLSKLQNLVLLDLSKSGVVDGQVLNVLHIPALRDLYINESNISKEVISALTVNRPELKIHTERGKIF